MSCSAATWTTRACRAGAANFLLSACGCASAVCSRGWRALPRTACELFEQLAEARGTPPCLHERKARGARSYLRGRLRHPLTPERLHAHGREILERTHERVPALEVEHVQHDAAGVQMRLAQRLHTGIDAQPRPRGVFQLLAQEL